MSRLRFRKWAESARRHLDRTARMGGIVAIFSVLGTAVFHKPGLTQGLITAMPVAFGTLVFLGLGFSFSALSPRRLTCERRVATASLYIATIVAVKWIDDRFKMPFYDFPTLNRTDFIWFDWRWCLIATALAYAALLERRQNPKREL